MHGDWKKLQGVWYLVSQEIDGRSLGGTVQVSIDGERFESVAMGERFTGVIRLDPDAKPKTIDLAFDGGPEAGNVNRGIYQLSGGYWRLALATRASSARPAEFASPAGQGIAVQVFSRQPAAALVEPEFDLAALDLVAVPELEGEWHMSEGWADGHAMDARMVKSAKRVVTGSEMSVMFGAQVYSKGRFTVDRSTNPAQMDIFNLEGTNAGKVQQAIWRVSENGRELTLAIAAAGAGRPPDFQPRPGDGRTVVHWRRDA